MMRSKKSATLMILATVATSLLFSGCSSNRVSLAEERIVSVSTQDSKNVNVLWTDVYEDAGRTWIYGVLKQQGSSSGAIKTHVDVQVLAPDGSVSWEMISDDVYVPRPRVGKGIDWTKFTVPLPARPAEGSQITLTVHSGCHPQTGSTSSRRPPAVRATRDYFPPDNQFCRNISISRRSIAPSAVLSKSQTGLY